MNRTKLNWGLLSTARINRAVIPPIRRSRIGVLSAVASRAEEKARDYAREWEIPRFFGSYEAMLSDPEIDIVYIPLPNSLHKEWTIKAVQAGKHVLCEKPLAQTVADVDEMLAAANATGMVVAEAFMYRHHPQTIQAKALLDQGVIGDLRLISSSFSFVLNRPGDVRLNPALGGGSIWDIGCYPISYIRYLIGAEPTEVFGWQKTGDTGVDETFFGQMRFSGDIFAQFDCSFRMTHRTSLEIVGTEGTIILKRPFTPRRVEVIEVKVGDQVKKHVIRSGDLYAGEVEDMHNAILEGTKPTVPLTDSRGTIRAINALLESARTREPIAVG